MLLAVALGGAAVLGPRALAAAPNFFFGFSSDEPKAFGSAATGPAGVLGARAFRITLPWAPGETTLSASDIDALDRVVAASAGLRIVIAAYGKAREAPLDDQSRDNYCAYVRSALERYPSIRDVVIWNEPNLSKFWQPQFDATGASAAPAAYEALLARCWDVLHAFDDAVNVIAPATGPHGNDNLWASSNVSHSPGNFISKMAAAYRLSGRPRRILDTVGHHVYGATPDERPWKMHANTDISEGDWGKLVDVLTDSFRGTGQAVPGECWGGRCVAIWYLEGGFQTTIDEAKRPLYTETENVRALPDDVGGEEALPTPHVDTPAPDQSTQIRYAVRLAYCQPFVEAFFNFMLWDESKLPAWQSGPFWTDGTPKGSYPAFAETAGAVNSGAVDCSPPKAPGLVGETKTSPQRVELSWGRGTSAIGVAGYNVYRNGQFLGETEGLDYVDPNVSESARYAYTVRGYDAAGQLGGDSNVIRIGKPFTLTVKKRGPGRGIVASESSSAINCGSDCSLSAVPGSTVSLWATPFPGSRFAGWGGACKGSDECTVALDDDQVVTATFVEAPPEPPAPPISSAVDSPTLKRLAVATDGAGRVTSTPPGIDCGRDCLGNFLRGTSLVLNAIPAPEQIFVRWGGQCAVARRKHACSLELRADTAVIAVFAPRPCVVPRVKKNRLARAARAIVRSRCTVGSVRRKYAAARLGVVIAQHPDPLTRVPAGEGVNLVVSRGPRPQAP